MTDLSRKTFPTFLSKLLECNAKLLLTLLFMYNFYRNLLSQCDYELHIIRQIMCTHAWKLQTTSTTVCNVIIVFKSRRLFLQVCFTYLVYLWTRQGFIILMIIYACMDNTSKYGVCPCLDERENRNPFYTLLWMFAVVYNATYIPTFCDYKGKGDDGEISKMGKPVSPLTLQLGEVFI